MHPLNRNRLAQRQEIDRRIKLQELRTTFRGSVTAIQGNIHTIALDDGGSIRAINNGGPARIGQVVTVEIPLGSNFGEFRGPMGTVG